MGTGLFKAATGPFVWFEMPSTGLDSVVLLVAAVIAGLSFLLIKLIRNYRVLAHAQAGRLKAEQLQQQGMQFNVALNSMSQGLCIFDASERATLWNPRYLEIAGLTEEFMQAGCTLRDILEMRRAQGTFPLDIDKYRQEVLDDILARQYAEA